jgi:hypothetical protein
MSKEWDPYFYEYQDRGIIKWMGFFLSEHTAQLEETERENAIIPRLPQQSADQINYYLQRSIAQNKVLEIQLNTLNDLGLVQPHVLGTFRGFSDTDTLIIFDHKTGTDTHLNYNDIRHIRLHNYLKWFDVKNEDVVEDPFEDADIKSTDDDWVNDYFNDDNWIE